MAKDITVTTGSGERLPATVDLYTDAFRNDPILAYFQNNLSERKRNEYRPAMFRVFLTAGALNDATFYHATQQIEQDAPKDAAEPSRGCRALVLKPGKNIDGTITAIRAIFAGSWKLLNLGPGCLYRLFIDTEGQIKSVRKKTFRPGERWYYVASIATDEKDRGLSSEVIRTIQRTAQVDSGASVWLEASTTHSRDIYARLGFEMVEELTVGKGSAGANGLREKGGTGVPLWGMIWRPKSEVDS